MTPRRAWRAVRRRRSLILVPVLVAAPTPFRRGAGWLAGRLASLAYRSPSLPWIATLAVVLHRGAGDAPGATALARRLGTAPRARSGTRRRLGQLAWEFGAPDAATAILQAGRFVKNRLA